MDAVLLIVVAAIALGALVAGWFLGARPVAGIAAEREQARRERDAAAASAEEWRRKFNEIGVNLAAEAEKVKRIPELEAQLASERGTAATARSEADRLRPIAERVEAQDRELAALRVDKEALAAAKAAFERGEAERGQAHAAQLAQLKDLEAKVEARFAELAAKAVDGAHDKFLKQAAERFGHAERQSEEKLKSLLQPVETTLKRYDEKLDQIEKARTDSYGSLKEVVSQLSQSNDIVRRETQRLANVMGSSPKARGRWGEEQLRNILQSAGLAEGVDFHLQETVSDGERQLRPDCVIRLPNNRCIVVDVKCPLVAFEQAFDEETESVRGELLKRHADALKSYASDLGRKSYWQQFDISPDFVVMFIPGEHFLSAAAERAPRLIEDAFKNGVIIASTINMLGLAKIMAGLWRQEGIATQAREIAAIGKELHARIQTMGAHVASLGRNLRLATDNYDDFVGSLDRNVLTQARRFEELKVAEGNKPIVDPPTIEFVPKASKKLDERPATLLTSNAGKLADAAE